MENTSMREALEAARDLLLPQCNGGTAFAKACGETVNKIMDALKEERTSDGNAAAHAMTLDEAIAHAEDVANRCDTSCGIEHRQLAGWLKELRDVKRMPNGNAAAMREALTTAIILLKACEWPDDTPMQDVAEVIDEIEKASSAPQRNCDRFGGDIDRLREACLRERGLNPEEDFPDVFPDWLLALAKESGVRK